MRKAKTHSTVGLVNVALPAMLQPEVAPLATTTESTDGKLATVPHGQVDPMKKGD